MLNTKVGMRGITQLSLLILGCFALAQVSGRAAITPSDVVNYLTTYGYLKPLDPTTGRIRSHDELREAVKMLQRMGHISENGNLDDPGLLKLIGSSRCGVPDVGPADQAKRRRKRRYVLQGSKWLKTDLTYKIWNYTKHLPKKEVDDTMREAFNMWASITPLTFKRVYGSEKADININFTTYDHGDGYPFDGRGQTLAHAFYPQDNSDEIHGDAHFDDDEPYTLRTHKGINLLWVAVHEFGHSLGLDHSDKYGAVMYPWYQPYQPNFKLHSDDVAGVQEIYGKETPSSRPKPTDPDRVTPTPHTKTEAPGVPDKCSSPVDAFVTTQAGYTYAFKGDYFWPIVESGSWTSALKITDFWPLEEGNIEAAFLRRSDKANFLFKGDKFWMLKDRTSVKGPLPITDPELKLPTDLANMDAAFQWGRNNRVYFFKGERYWRYDPDRKQIDHGYPRKISEGWRSVLPNNIDAALQWQNGKTYFFKGLEYFAIDDYSLEIPKVDHPYPRSISTYWMGCSPDGLIGGKISPVESSAISYLPNLVAIVFTLILTKLF